jgi:anti-sigma regulatory factor (Ser/Thr protein kinase)
MARCELRIPADPENIRLARLVASAAARRAGLEPESVEDVRSAASEAVTRAVLRHGRSRSTSPVELWITDGPGTFRMEVLDRAGEVLVEGEDELAMAVIHGLTPQVEVGALPDEGQILRMTWPR